MRFSALSSALILTACAGLASCVAPPVQAPPPPPPRAEPAPPAPVATPAPPKTWDDRPHAAGDWRYQSLNGGSLATFANGGAPLFSIGCDVATRRISLRLPNRAGAQGNGASGMTLRTSFGAVQWPVQASADGIVAARAAGDAALDQLAFSRGSFAIETAGAPMLVLPAWAEISRVIEDCRA